MPLNVWQHARCLVALAIAPVRYGVAQLFTLKTRIDLPDAVPLMPQCHLMPLRLLIKPDAKPHFLICVTSWTLHAAPDRSKTGAVAQICGSASSSSSSSSSSSTIPIVVREWLDRSIDRCQWWLIMINTLLAAGAHQLAVTGRQMRRRRQPDPTASGESLI